VGAWLRRRGWQRTLVVVGLVALLAGAGMVTATVAAASSTDRVLAGVRVGGVDVGGLTRRQAAAAVGEAARRSLERVVVVQAAGRSWRVTPASLGRQAAVDQAVGEALAGPRLSWWAGVWHRVTDRPVRHSVDLAYRGGERGVAALVRTAARAVNARPRDASITLVGGRVERRHARTGRSLDTRGAARALTAAVGGGAVSVRLPVRTLAPRVRDHELGKTIAVDVGRNRLTLYRGLTVERRYPVATAMPGFYTPRGTWKVLYKEVDPTWHNPAPDGWGKGEPLVIPPGPDNPLGTRALALSAPGILIHGSPAAWSIGGYHSHGCIRMLIRDAENLFPRVPAGTTVLIHGGGPASARSSQAAGA